MDKYDSPLDQSIFTHQNREYLWSIADLCRKIPHNPTSDDVILINFPLILKAALLTYFHTTNLAPASLHNLQQTMQELNRHQEQSLFTSAELPYRKSPLLGPNLWENGWRVHQFFSSSEVTYLSADRHLFNIHTRA